MKKLILVMLAACASGGCIYSKSECDKDLMQRIKKIEKDVEEIRDLQYVQIFHRERVKDKDE